MSKEGTLACLGTSCSFHNIGQRRTGRRFWPLEGKPWLHRIFAFAGSEPLMSALLDRVDGGEQGGGKEAGWKEEEHHFFCPVSKSAHRLVFIHSLVRKTVPGAYLLSQKVYKQI